MIQLKITYADTPYSINFVELPISVDSESKLSLFDNIIAYKSDSNKISIYNIKTNESKVISNTNNSVIEPFVHGNYVLYAIQYRGISELMKYDLLTEKTNALMPFESRPAYSVENNILIAYADCDIYPDHQKCVEGLKQNAGDEGIIAIDLTKDADYPSSITEVKCEVSRESLKTHVDGIRFKKEFYPQDPREPSKCRICNVLTGDVEFTAESECHEKRQTKCSIGNTAFDDNWEIETNRKEFCYSNEELDYALYNGEVGIPNLEFIDANGDKIVFKESDGKVYLGQVVYGNLVEICRGFSEIKSSGKAYAENKCDIGANNTCRCRYTLVVEEIGFSSSDSYSFSLINLGQEKLMGLYNKATDIVEQKLSAHTLQLKTIEEEKQKELFAEQERIRKEKEEQLFLEKQEAKEENIQKALIILLILSPFVYICIRSYLKKKRMEEKRKKEEEERERIEAERKKKLEEVKIKKEEEMFRKEQERIKEEEKRIRERKEKNKKIVEERKRKIEEEKIKREQEILRQEKEKFEKKQEAKGLVKYKEKWGTPEEVKKWEEEDYKKSFPYLVQKEIDEFKPSRKWVTEEGYQGELQGWIKTKFPHSRVEEQRGSSRPDLIIGDLAIEIKGPTGSIELATIADKCMRYALHFNPLIIVLFDVRVNYYHYEEWLRALKKQHPNVVVIKK